MYSPLRVTLAILIFGAVLSPLVQATTFATSLLNRRDPVPEAIPSCATEGDLRWQPVLDFDKDGCYNTPAIGADGFLNGGQDPCYVTGPTDCRDEPDLDNNQVYSRARCNNGWCAYMYGYYFEKDVAAPDVCGFGAGHRHDWEHIVVWVKDGSVLWVSASGHGKYHIQAAEEVRWEGEHPKLVYNKDGGSTHLFRFAAEQDDEIENHKGIWFRGALLSYEGFPNDDLRTKMITNDWGKGKIDFSDERFAEALTMAKEKAEISLDVTYDDPGSPGDPGC